MYIYIYSEILRKALIESKRFSSDVTKTSCLKDLKELFSEGA